MTSLTAASVPELRTGAVLVAALALAAGTRAAVALLARLRLPSALSSATSPIRANLRPGYRWPCSITCSSSLIRCPRPMTCGCMVRSNTPPGTRSTMKSISLAQISKTFDGLASVLALKRGDETNSNCGKSSQLQLTGISTISLGSPNRNPPSVRGTSPMRA